MDAGSGRPLFSLDVGSSLTSVRTDGWSAVTVGEEGVVRGWNMRGAEQIFQYDTEAGKQMTLAVNHDASLLCVANQKAVLLTKTE